MNTPNYYKGKYYGMEAHEVIEDFCGDNYNLGVALAYLMRCGKKPDNDIRQDINKAIDHLLFELKRQDHLRKPEKIHNDTTNTMYELSQDEIDRINNKIFYNGTSTY